MGGRRGASRQWGFGDDSDGEENAPRYVTKGGNRAPSSTQAGTSNPPSAAPMAMQKGEGLVVGRGGRNGMKGGLGVEIGGDMNGKGNNMDTEEHRKIYEKGLQMRTQVLGEQYVNKSLRETEGNEFMRPFVQFATVRSSPFLSFSPIPQFQAPFAPSIHFQPPGFERAKSDLKNRKQHGPRSGRAPVSISRLEVS